MKLLLISNSTNPGTPYLDYPKDYIKDFLAKEKTKNIVFIPYAAVTFSFDEYEDKVNNALADIKLKVKGIHRFKDPIKAIENSDVIIIGGGNTWQLTKLMYDNKLIPAIRKQVKKGVPYIGWSAGSNVACPTLCTTNDMPILQPKSFKTLNLVPFQINPHYLDVHPENHGGETREMRITEYIISNKNKFVVGLREGTILLVDNKKIFLLGDKSARIFKYGEKPKELKLKDDFSFLLKV